MKTKVNRIVSLFAAAGLACGGVACKKESPQTDPVTGNEPSSASAASVTKRAQTFGFASRLPADVDAVYGLLNMDNVLSDFTGSEFFKRIATLSQGAVSVEQADFFRGEAAKYIGKDAFIVFADGSAEQFDRLMVAYDYYYKLMYPMMLQGMMAGAGGGAPMMDPGEIFKQAIESDDGKLLELGEKIQIPGIMMGFRVEGGTDELIAQLADIEGQLPPTAVVSEVTVPGAETKFKSWAIAAKDAVGEAERAAMREEIGDEALAGKLEKIIDSKTVDFTFGAIGDYMLLSLGENHDHLKLAEKPEDSLLSHDRFGFADAYLEKDIMGYYYVSEEMSEAANHPEQMLALTGSVQKFLDQMAEGGMDLGETSNLIGKAGELLVKLSDRECFDGLGVAYREDGIRIESIGGYSMPGVDPELKLRFADAISEDTFLGFTTASTAEAEENSMELMETIAKAMHTGASKFAAMQPDSDFGQQFGQMDAVFRPKLTALWTIMREKVQGGLGRESGLYIDLNGSAPKIPGVPQVLVNEGKVPRIAIMANVDDRAKLAEGWSELVPAINELAKMVPGQEPGREFQLPDVTSFDNNGYATHFMQLPLAGGDFIPSISVSDDLFLMSTSKDLSNAIAGKAKEGDVTGVVFHMSFDALRVFAEDWVKLVMNNADEVFAGNEFQADNFREQAAMMQMGLELMKAMKKIRHHSFVEDGEWRGSTHIHFGDIAPKVD